MLNENKYKRDLFIIVSWTGDKVLHCWGFLCSDERMRDILSAESNALLSLKLINLGKTLLTGEETKLYWFVTKPDTPNYACIPIKFFEMFIWYIRWTNPHSVAIRKQITNIRYHLISNHPIWTSSEKCFCHS